MKKSVIPAALVFLSALTISVLGCGYGPNFESGRLRCAAEDDSCPEGYYCAGDGRCWRDGEAPGGTRDRFIGDWSFVRNLTGLRPVWLVFARSIASSVHG